MRLAGAMIAVAVLSVSLSSCSGGGGGTTRVIPAPSASPAPATSSTPELASIAFTIGASSGSQSALRPGKGRRPSYVAASTQGVTIQIAYPGTTFPPITATKQCDATGQNCSFAASKSLPIEPDAYTFSFSAYGKTGSTDLLSTGMVSQVLVPGPNVVDATLGAVVASATLKVSGGPPTTSGTAVQSFPVTFTAFDADGNQVTGTTPYAFPFQIAYQEVDDLGAYALQAGSTGSASCNPANSACGITSNADTLEVTFNPQASSFSSDPGYYPSEFVIYDANQDPLTAENSADISTAPCSAPKPICVYPQPYYAALLSSHETYTNFLGFSPTVLALDQATIWTDAGVISTGTTPSFLAYPRTGALASQAIGSLAYVPATQTAFAPDYTGNASQASQQINSISSSATVATALYPTDTNTLEGAPSGAGIIVGPDGNLWWIDPITGVLRYANPKSPGSASSCVLSADSNTFLTAAEIVPTPPGVTPARIWFSAIDTINTESYLGYVAVFASGNSCGAGEAGHYTAFDTADEGTPTPPNGLAVDGSGNAWYDEGDDLSYTLTSIGEATVNANTGAVSVPGSKQLPGALGSAGQAWGIVYDQLDHEMYFAADNGLIGRFDPASGVASATAYALPAPIANLYDLSSGPETADQSCGSGVGPVPVPGPCVPQFTWDAGSSALGRLTFVIPAANSTIAIPFGTNVVAQLDLSGTGVSFSAQARSRFSPRYAHRHARGNRHRFTVKRR